MPKEHAVPEYAAETNSAPKPRILVVDDSRVIRKAINRILAEEFDLIEAEDGEAGWQTLQSDETIQVVISDVEMPKLDGHALLEKMRSAESPHLRAIPVIIITGADDEPARQKAYACGATDFVTKPIDGVQLLARAHAHAKFDQAARQLAETFAKLEDQAILDPLTQLYTRRCFMDRLTQAIAFARRHQMEMAVIRIDIDGFKTIFEQHGDDACDELLVQLARVFRAKTRKEECCARIGGAEFAVIAPSANVVDGMVLCERLRLAVESEDFACAGQQVPLTISLGIAPLEDASTPEDLLASAHRQVCRAKAAGGNRAAPGQLTEPPPARARPAHTSKQQQAQQLTTPLAVDAALALLDHGDTEELKPHLVQLGLRVLPLLELCNRRLGLGLGFALKSFEDKLAEKK